MSSDGSAPVAAEPFTSGGRSHRISFLALPMLIVFCCAAWAPSSAQDASTPAGPTSISQDTEPKANAADSSSKSGTDTPAPKEKQQKRGAFVAVPIPMSSPALGSGIAPVGGYIFSLRKEDKVSPPSVIGAAGLITNDGSRGFAVGGEFYFREDTYRATVGIARGNLDYNFYGTGVVAGDAGRHVSISQEGQVVFGEFLRCLKWDVFVGPRIWFGNSTISAKNPLQPDDPQIPDLQLNTVQRAIGFRIQRETPPNRFYPTKGSLLNFTADFFSQGMGGTYSFQAYRFTFNKYKSFGEKQVLAYNLYLCGTGGEAPFYGECVYGMNNEPRGYTAGRYIDTYMVATQLEYRRSLWWRIGVVAFGGVGEVSPAIAKFNLDNLLPAGGAGVRFNMSKKYHVNLRADIAEGKNGHTFSMGLGEAF